RAFVRRIGLEDDLQLRSRVGGGVVAVVFDEGGDDLLAGDQRVRGLDEVFGLGGGVEVVGDVHAAALRRPRGALGLAADLGAHLGDGAGGAEGDRLAPDVVLVVGDVAGDDQVGAAGEVLAVGEDGVVDVAQRWAAPAAELV